MINNDLLSHPLVKISVWRRHTKTVENGASSHKANYITIFSEILNLEEHQNCCSGLKVTVIFLNWWILPTGGGTPGVLNIIICATFTTGSPPLFSTPLGVL